MQQDELPRKGDLKLNKKKVTPFFEARPVCGNDGVTYRNLCELQEVQFPLFSQHNPCPGGRYVEKCGRTYTYRAGDVQGWGAVGSLWQVHRPLPRTHLPHKLPHGGQGWSHNSHIVQLSSLVKGGLRQRRKQLPERVRDAAPDVRSTGRGGGQAELPDHQVKHILRPVSTLKFVLRFCDANCEAKETNFICASDGSLYRFFLFPEHQFLDNF